MNKDGAGPELWQQGWTPHQAGSTGALSFSGSSSVSSFMWVMATTHSPESAISLHPPLCVTLGKDVIYLSLGNNNTIIWLSIS